MIPVRLYGVYILSACSKPSYIGSELMIDYNNVKFSLIKRIGPIKYCQNVYGSFQSKNDTVNVLWLPSGDYDIDTYLLPTISYPYIKNGCKRMRCTYCEQENWLTVRDPVDQYVFRKKLFPDKKQDKLIQIFFTQLVFDFVIRHLR
jgi:hypothetical protein